jgi:hypothetical protein
MAKSKRNVKQSKRKSRRVLKKNINKRILGGLPLSNLTVAVIGALFGLAKENDLVTEQKKEVGPSEQFAILNELGDSRITKLLQQQEEKPEVDEYDPELVWDNFEWSKFVKSQDTDTDYLNKMKSAKKEEKKIAAMKEAAEKGDKLDKAVGR